MRWRGRAAVGAVAIVVAAAGCTSGDGSKDSSNGTSPTNASVSAVSQTLLPGIACPAESERCDLDARVALFMRQLDENGCPALVSVQEANERTVALLREEVPTTCDGEYTVVWDDDPG